MRCARGFRPVDGQLFEQSGKGGAANGLPFENGGAYERDGLGYVKWPEVVG